MFQVRKITINNYNVVSTKLILAQASWIHISWFDTNTNRRRNTWIKTKPQVERVVNYLQNKGFYPMVHNFYKM